MKSSSKLFVAAAALAVAGVALVSLLRPGQAPASRPSAQSELAATGQLPDPASPANPASTAQPSTAAGDPTPRPGTVPATHFMESFR